MQGLCPNKYSEINESPQGEYCFCSKEAPYTSSRGMSNFEQSTKLLRFFISSIAAEAMRSNFILKVHHATVNFFL